jgi:hypothetical protein
MTTLAMKNELLQHLNRLPTAMQCQVLQFARALEMTTHAGVPGAGLISFAGCIPPDDLGVIAQAVEEGCERVDAHEW